MPRIFLCEYIFSIGATVMVNPLQAHRNSEYMEVHSIQQGAKEECLRPENHSPARASTFLGGSDANFDPITLCRLGILSVLCLQGMSRAWLRYVLCMSLSVAEGKKRCGTVEEETGGSCLP